ncbi:hypothetical protein BC943DRAFT_363628 [Umbelopsis sp. AD052]|nr:hypothetical protein BC943DRAFT_363628 [Umbelopsis sp. AD052]
MTSSMSFTQLPGLQMAFWYFDVPQRIAVWCLTTIYRMFPDRDPKTAFKRSRQLAYLLCIFYVIGILGTLIVTFRDLPMNYYQHFGASCQDLDLGLLKRLFRRLSLIYHPDKNPDPEAMENFVRLRTAYETLTNDNRREVYNRMGPNLKFVDNSATVIDCMEASARRMAQDHVMSLLFQFGVGFFAPAMKITRWKIILLTVFVAIELNILASSKSCDIRVLGHPFLLHELLLLTRHLYHSLNVAVSRIIPHFVNKSQGVSDGEVTQQFMISQALRSQAIQDYQATIQPFLGDDGMLIEEMRVELARLQAGQQQAAGRPHATMVSQPAS